MKHCANEATGAGKCVVQSPYMSESLSVFHQRVAQSVKILFHVSEALLAVAKFCEDGLMLSIH